MTNGFALNHDKSLQIYFFCVKCQAENDFLKDVKSSVGVFSMWMNVITSKNSDSDSMKLVCTRY